MKTISMETVARALWDEYLCKIDDPKAVLKYADFRRIMYRTKTVAAPATIRAKWDILGGETGVQDLQEDAYIIDRKLFAMAHGMHTYTIHTHTHTHTQTTEEASE